MLPYFEKIHALLAEAERRNAETIAQCAAVIAASLAEGGVLHTFGTGHGHMLAEELFYRAGGLAPVNAILDPALMLHESALSSTHIERLPGYADIVLSRYAVRPGEVIIIASNSGRNAVPIEMALAAQQRGLKVIALTSLAHSQSQPSRHAGGRKLYELADYVLDNCGEVGDAALAIDGLAAKVGPTSTVIGVSLLHALVYAVVQKLHERGLAPPVIISANVGHSDDENSVLFARYRDRLRHL